ncbi:MAG: gliding motility-associated C-terminal domain-containing protein [Bacteroidota bacterium]
MQKLLFLLLLPLGLCAQVCEGNLGDNIFEDGDFGAGIPNILSANPGIAPSYEYSNLPPPFDGSYTITNSSGAWSNLFPTWLEIEDNSPDPNGYMMVVNASFDPGLFYDQTIENLCDDTQYAFSADIINMIAPGTLGHILPNVSFLINGVVEFSTGEIAQTGSWNTYGFTFTTQPGQTEVQLSLRNNAPGGTGNDLALDNISFRTCGDAAFILPETIANICEDGEPIVLDATVEGNLFNTPAYQWQISPDGLNNWTDIPGATTLNYTHNILTAGFYYYRFRVANGEDNLANEKCTINSNVKIVQVLPKEYFVADTSCLGATYLVGNSGYTETGNYVDSLLNALGCDSIIYTDLTVVDPPPLQWELAIGAPSCFNNVNGTIEVLNAGPANLPSELFFNGLPVGNTSVFPDLVGDNFYPLRLVDRHNCTFDTLVYLPIPDVLTLDLGANQMLNLGETATVTALTNFPVERYFWSSTSPNALPCGTATDCPTLDWLPTNSQTVYLTAEDQFGCTITDSVQLTVSTDYRIYAPNVFSPNRDGVNDQFTLFGDSPRITSVASLQIFDRWGKLVFDQQNLLPGSLTDGWDGTVQGQTAPAGVYLYQASVLFLDGTTRVVSGDVMLLR